MSALNRYGIHHCVSEATGVQIMLRGDDDAAELVGALVGEGIRVTELTPLQKIPRIVTTSDVRPGAIAGFVAHDGVVPGTHRVRNY